VCDFLAVVDSGVVVFAVVVSGFAVVVSGLAAVVGGFAVVSWRVVEGSCTVQPPEAARLLPAACLDSADASSLMAAVQPALVARNPDTHDTLTDAS